MQHNLAPATLQQLQIFFTIAETLNLFQASHELAISQDKIIKELKKLELLLDFPLFEGQSPYLRLTTKGSICYQSWFNIISTIEQGVNRALFCQTTDADILRIGVPYNADYHVIHQKMIAPFQTQYPNITLVSSDDGIPQLEARLAQHNLDVILMPHSQIYGLDSQIHRWKYLATSPLYLLVSAKHPLAQCTSVRMSDILHIPVIVLDPTITNNALFFLKNLYRPYGKIPSIVGYYQSKHEITGLLEETNGLCIVGNYFPEGLVEDCKRILITGQYGGLVAVWNKFSGKECVENFVNLVAEDEALFPITGISNLR